MQNYGVEPNIATYGILMNLHAENRDFKKCEYYFE
jgi:pentatricopeptide repeat protein